MIGCRKMGVAVGKVFDKTQKFVPPSALCVKRGCEEPILRTWTNSSVRSVTGWTSFAELESEY